MSIKRLLALDTIGKVGETVKVCGWAQTIRDHGSLIFIDLRDWSGVVQIVVDEKDKKIFEVAKVVGSEYVLSVEGKVVEKEKELQNEKIPTGKVEIKASKFEILNESKTPPFPLSEDGREIDEFKRMKYRFVDMRRKRVRDLIESRHKLLNFVTEWFSKKGFTQVQTPLLTVSSPEGARDFVVPSRLYPGKFYALPQAPQQYKQLLMVGGLHRYFQIAPCMRDEDPRTDRHYGTFYQVDAELSFVDQDEVFESIEPFFKEVVETLTNKKLKQYPIPRISYTDIMETYGSDKADLRFEMKLTDLTDIFKSSSANIFKNVELVKGILVDREFTRKEIDIWTENMKKQGANGLAWFKVSENGFEGPLVKYFQKNDLKKIKVAFEKNGYEFTGSQQTVFAVAGNHHNVNEQMGWLRSKMGDLLGLKDENTIAFAWVVDFNMFEWDEERKAWDFMHNPFSMPSGGLEALKKQDPGEIKAQQYDFIGNGYELLSGSIRNHHPETFIEAFKICGYSEQETREKFGHMISAFEYGAPPHGGYALGFDRFAMILFDENNIREVYAFPMSGGQEIMTGSPREISKEVLDELGLKLK
jgi:aspartyl-tRNA synthetase